MCRYWLTCVCLLVSLSSPPHAAVTRAAAALPLLDPGVVQEDYSQQITMTVSGAAPFTYLLGGEDKPAGLLLDPQSGVLHGSPTAAALGTHRLKVIVTDYNGKQTSKDFLLRVTQKPASFAGTAAGAEAPGPAAAADTPEPAAAADAPEPALAADAPKPAAAVDAPKPAAPVKTVAVSNGNSSAVPSITAAAEDASTVTVQSPAFPKGVKAASYTLATLDAGKPCAKGSGTPLALQAKSPVAAVSAKETKLSLAEPLKKGSIVCAAETLQGNKTVLYSKPFPATAAIAATPAPGAQGDAAASIPTPSIASATAGVKTLSIASGSFPTGAKSATFEAFTVDPGKACAVDASKQLVIASGTGMRITSATTTTLTLAQDLQQNSQVCAVETFHDGDDKALKTAKSNVVTVTSLEANWGRIRAYFVGGMLITNDSSSFSSAHQFYALNVDKTWKLPRCYLRDDFGPDGHSCGFRSSVEIINLAGGIVTLTGDAGVTGTQKPVNTLVPLKKAIFTVTAPETIDVEGTPQRLDPGGTFSVDEGSMTNATLTDNGVAAGATVRIKHGELVKRKETVPKKSGFWHAAGRDAGTIFSTPGVSTYFETRLTSIPVVSNSTNTTSSSTTPANSFLSSQQTANVGVGVYLPFLITRWNYNNTPNALFIAPIGKVGFNTLTGATSQTVVLPSNGGPGTQSFEQIYNHYDYGFRVGHMALTTATNVAPETLSYLDIGFGRFSNLEDLVCHRMNQGGGPAPSTTGCGIYQNQNYSYDSRKRLYRMDIEGLLKIPDTIFYVGLNANIGQKQVMAEKLDPKFTAPDDLRFLFGTKFDIAQLFAKLGVKTQ